MQDPKRDSQKCLQHAMWTLASSLSTQLQHIQESLYDCTRHALTSLESNDNNAEFADLDHVQARVLLLIYEFMRTNHQRAWISAGRCIRLVQLMRLYEVDSVENVKRQHNAADPEDWIRIEEKRRTFWMVYSLDRFISIRHEWPLAINEQVASFSDIVIAMCSRLIQSRSQPVSLAPRMNSRAAGMCKWVFSPKP